MLIEGNEIAFNNYGGYAGFDQGWEAGGTKFVQSDGLILRNNYVHDNGGPGLWCDGNNIHTIYDNNRIENNDGPGIDHEISYDAVISSNIVRNNSVVWSGGKSLWWGANIYIHDSSNVEIYGNFVEGDANGIGLRDQDRGSGSHGVYEVRNVYVHDNTVIMRAGQTGMVTDRLANLDPTSNRFVRNHYSVPLRTGTFWQWNAAMTWPQWQAIPQDATGTADAVSSPARPRNLRTRP